MNKTFPPNTLVVVADGTHAMLYRNEAGDGNLKLKQVGELTPKNLEDDGPSGSRPPESSSQETDEATFAKQLAEYLYQEAHKNNFADLVLAADPQTLGQLRPCLHQEVTDRILKEVDKTHTNSPVEDIERSLS
ncbi:host attachment family protein [Novipirellula sp.]|uniref:host attachment family protein n=1 Tax=Novipirellula sp. TaxID=2795430 RepID=UPI0035688AAC